MENHKSGAESFEDSRLKMLTDNDGKIIFVGTLRQIKRRLRRMLKNPRLNRFGEFFRTLGQKLTGDGPEPFLLWQSGNIGYTIRDAESPAKFQSSMDHLRKKLKDVPKEPGVYQFKDAKGEVIYVGKAKSLKDRIAQYLGGKDERPQMPFLMSEAADFDYTVLSSELESLFLENTVIKQYLPKYNIQLRDDKNYAFITIDYGTQIPRIGYARKVDAGNKKIRHFGPYSAAYKIRNTLNLIRRIFPYCAAQEVGTRPCFYYYLHRCPGVCIGKISLEEYGRQLDKICNFLSGNTKKVKSDLKTEMQKASLRQKFEQAAKLRDQLSALELLDEKQLAILPKAVFWDVISLALDQGYACVNLFKVRGGKLFDKENFVYEVSENFQGQSRQVMQNFLERYYLEASGIPKEIFLQTGAENTEVVAQLVKARFSKTVKFRLPKRGKPLELARLGGKNAEEYLKNWLSGQAGHLDKISASLAGLKEVLGLSRTPERIEGYDISNIQGANAVGSMVVFKQGLPCKSEYRKFRIRGKSTPDDFAMMKEMLTRRLARLPGRGAAPAWELPDLMVIDGGKGQLAVAVEALKNAGAGIPVIGLAKRLEEIFVPGKKQPVILALDSPALQVLQRLRDEAHRFGLSYHRDLRSRQAVKSALDDIPGLGPKTKKLLKQKFGTVANMRKASMKELEEAVGERIARLIQQSL